MLDRVLRFSLIAASGVFICFGAVIIMVSMTLSAAADNVLVIDQFDDSVITGIIKDKGNNELTLDVNGKEVDVDTTGMELDPVEDLLKEGAIVKVQGEFRNDRFDARKIILSDEQAIEDLIEKNQIIETSTNPEKD